MKFVLKSIVFIIPVLILRTIAYCNNNDSLLKIIESSKTDTVIIETYNELAWSTYHSDPAKAIEYSKKALDLSHKANYIIGEIDSYNRLGTAYLYHGESENGINCFQKSLELAEKHNFIEKKSIAINNLGLCYDNMGLFDKALELYNMSLDIETKLNNKEGMAAEYLGIGNVYKSKGEYTEALKYYLKSLKIKEEIGNKASIATTMISIGGLYYTMGDLKTALDYFKKVYEIRKNIDDKSGLADILSNLGIIYQDTGQPDSALMKYDESLKINMELGQEAGVASAYINIAGVYYQKYDFKKAIEYNQKSLDIRQKMGDLSGVSFCNTNFGSIYLALNDNETAIKYFKKALDYAIKYDVKDSQRYIAKILSETYANQKQYENAYKYHVLYKNMTDSLNNEENVKKFTQLEMQYNFDKIQKQQQFEEQQKELNHKAELSHQRVIRNSFIFGFILMAILSWVILRSYRQKKRDNKLLEARNQEIMQQKEEITSQRDEIEAQRNLVTQQKEHIEEIHEELTDSISYAKRIQQALLPDLSAIARKPQADEAILSSEEKIASLPLAMTFDYFILFRPKDVVSGDFYWATHVNGWFVACVADCTGHGVPGAFMSMLGISFLNEIVRRKEVTKASDVLNHLRNSIIEALKQTGASSTSDSGSMKDGMDISLIAINTTPQAQTSEGSETQPQAKTSEGLKPSEVLWAYSAQWAGANNPLWIIRNKSLRGFQTLEGVGSILEELKPDKMPIAIHPVMKPFTNHEITLQKGDMLYILSDGFQDQFGGTSNSAELKKFKSKRLREILRNNAHLTMPEQKEKLEVNLKNWMGDSEQIDDITILGLQI